MQIPPGWIRLDTEPDGVPLFKRQGGPVYVATCDMDQLRFLGAALTHFERMTPAEFADFITGVGS